MTKYKVGDWVLFRKRYIFVIKKIIHDCYIFEHNIITVGRNIETDDFQYYFINKNIAGILYG